MVEPTVKATASSEPNRRAFDPMRAFLRSLIVIVVPLVALTGCGKNYDWHQKLTVEVETPEGLKTASSVMSARLIDTHGPFVPAEANGVSFQLNGEAVALEVSQGRYLFVLLKSVPALNWLVYPNMDSTKAGALLENGDDGGAGEVELKPDQYPLLVTFDDINNPASVKRVAPANLEATFGPGYRLNGITLSLTKEPVTKGEVEKVLPAAFFKRWGGKYREALADGGIKNPFFKTFAATLGRDSFTTDRD